MAAKKIQKHPSNKPAAKQMGISTLSVHGGEERHKYADSVTVPIVQTSTFVFQDENDIREYTSGKKKRFEYARYGNPTTRTAELKLAALEGAEDALLFDCGMSAVSTSLLSMLSSGDHIVITSDVYKKTLQFVRNDLSRFGILNSVVPPRAEDIASAIRPETKLIFSESPTNPYVYVLDFKKLAAVAKKAGVPTFVDSTFATPYNVRPLEYGIDMVMHSATKYLAGHNDIMAGVVLGSEERINKVKMFQKTVGGCIDAHASYLLLRGLKTFALRVNHQNASALAVARFLENHPRIKRVWYPGLPSHPSHKIAKSQMRGFGGCLSFEVNSNMAGVQKFLRNLRLCQMGPSLGGTETLITHPATITYYDMTRPARLKLGITDQLVRLAVGVEDPEDIIADLDAALSLIK
ncbi:MAG TPA: PLP-dependent aspartate aminotransferase family protein [bacterium]|nr:PLP-dependent aspartate aminotransferase family protein [bacterium]